MNILLTGGAGYIGSHAAVVLTEAGHQVVILDNFCNSHRSVLERLAKILGKTVPCVEGDVRDTILVKKVLKDYHIDAVMHFAGLKAVGESVANPLKYFDNNVTGSINLLLAMQAVGVRHIVFSSSATVYGEPKYLPYDEYHPLAPVNAYGETKLQVENMLKDLSLSDSTWHVALLRYFNPVGAHDSGLIGEDPSGIPNNLMPYVAKVAAGELPHLNIFGNDYPTKDGTGERDYIHVMDLTEGHLAALKFLDKNDGCHVFNLGTGDAKSVLELVRSFEKVSEKIIPIKIEARRDGDLPAYYAKAGKASQQLGWKASRTLDEMCSSTWRWQEFRKTWR
jgi:UDP-glucose 4-epimerase